MLPSPGWAGWMQLSIQLPQFHPNRTLAPLAPQALDKTQSRRFPGCAVPSARFLLWKERGTGCLAVGLGQKQRHSRDCPKPNHSRPWGELTQLLLGTPRPSQALGTCSSGDSSRSKGTRGRTRSRTSGPTGFARRLRLRRAVMEANLSTGTSAKDSTQVSTRCGVRGGKSYAKMGGPEQTPLLLLSNRTHHQIILNYTPIPMS